MSSVEKEERRISRRDFAKGAAVVGAGVLASCGPTPAPQIIKETVEVPVEVEKIVKETVQVPVEVTKIVEKVVEVPAEAGEAGPVVLEVFDPYGPFEVTQLFSPRLDTLEGKTIAYSEGAWLVGRAKPLVLDLLQKQFPTLEVVDIPGYNEIGRMRDDQASALLEELGVDAVIVGNAG